MLQSHIFDINNLHLGQIIGEGAQASVRLAVDPYSSTQIAIKILQKSSSLDLQAVCRNSDFRPKKSLKSIIPSAIKILSKCFRARRTEIIYTF